MCISNKTKNDVLFLLPHYNDESGLIKTLDSLSVDAGFDICLIDDGSNDGFPNIEYFQSIFCQGKNRIFKIENDNNLGIVGSLNLGLKLAQKHSYTYVARLDCGDLYVKGRVDSQRAILDNYSDVALVSCWSEAITGEGTTEFFHRPKVDTHDYRRKLFYGNYILHPSVMIREKVVRSLGGYRNIKAAEDYDLFFRISQNHRIIMIENELLKFRVNDGGISQKKRSTQTLSTIKVSIRNFEFCKQFFVGLFFMCIKLLIPQDIQYKLKKAFRK